MKTDNNFGRLLLLLVCALIISLAMYGLPDELLGHKIKKVDLLSDIRVKPKALSRDSLKQILAQAEPVEVDTVALRDSVIQSTGIDSAALTRRETLYKDLYAVEGADSLGLHIEDYSPGHIALKRFFAALNNSGKMDRPVRIAFLGDSFVEGDILVSDLRSLLQKEFGGRGVGFVPVTSVAAQFRPTVEQKTSGWKTLSLVNDTHNRFTLPGMLFETEGERATLSVKNTDRFPELPVVSTVKLLYENNENTRMRLLLNGGTDSVIRPLPPTGVITQNVLQGTFTEADYTFTQTDGFRALGVALEDDKGVVVDNFSLRGNSGMILDRLDKERSRELTDIRPYDLIILQYGLNIVNEEMLNYGWYGKRMVSVIQHIQSCFPDTDILMLSVSDRAHQEHGGFETMPAVLSLLHTQRQTAKQTGIAFWNLFGGMGGEDSMVDFVEKGWASKDYTHLSFRGGKQIATALYNVLMTEKEFYDEAEKAIH